MKIVKASAGSGKTYTLSRHFIDILLESRDRYAYRHILAVTFTNKATEEMKSRILRDLHGMAGDNPAAKMTLTDILHDYSAFSVSTIDSFFQRTLKAFAREMGQFSDYQVELDRDSLIREAVDRVLDSLEDNGSELLDWIMEGVMDTLSQGGKLSLENGLCKMGCQVKSFEVGRELEGSGLSWDEAFSKNHLREVSSACARIVSGFRDKCRERGVELKDEGFIQFKKKSMAGLEEEHGLYATAFAIRKSLYNLGLAGEFLSAFEAVLREKNVVCLDDSNQILKAIIDGSDAPFIYEKTGVRYDHFLLDEFQDTSVVQWENFKPLMDESESHGGRSLVVGDVKQSIYRWRDSEWRLLSEVLPAQYPTAETKSLKYNWRSAATIVDFNNDLFRFAGKFMGLEDIYGDVYQEKASKDTGGMVRITCTPEQMDAVVKSIGDARGAGAAWSDIAVLVRTNEQGWKVSMALLEKDIPVISDDSLRVTSSVAVRKIMSVLNYVDNPDDRIGAYLAGELSADVGGTYHSLYDLCESVARVVGCDGAEPYVQAFLDEVKQWTKANGGNVHDFLQHMKESKLNITCPADSDAVRVMTIHKSKGLQFQYVIVPFVETISASRATEHWCVINDSEQDLRGIYPVSLSKNVANSLFRDRYERERRMKETDSLNEFYVACTRAVKGLHLITSGVSATYRNSKDKEVNNMACLLYLFLDGDEKVFGNMPVFASDDAGKDSGVEFEGGFASYPLDGRLRPSALAGDYFSGEGLFDASSSPRLDGIALHSVLAAVRIAPDLDRALAHAVHGGELTPEEAKSAEVLLRRAIESRSEWFRDGVQVFNETPVIVPGESSSVEKRPDRVVISGNSAIVIDYKFGSASPAYRHQVQEYCDLYRRMGYSEVKGYVWYVREDRVEEV